MSMHTDDNYEHAAASAPFETLVYIYGSNW